MDLTLQVKTCKTCKIEKPITEFGKNRKTEGTNFRKTSKDSYKPYCKSCLAIQAKAYRDSRPGLWKEYAKARKEGTSKIAKYSTEERYLISAIRTKVTASKGNNKRTPDRDFNIDTDYMYQLWKNQDGKCYLTGADLTLEKGKPNTLSIDKVFPEKGYVKGNVRWSAWAANRAKGDMSFSVFHAMCERITEKCNDYRKDNGEYEIPLFEYSTPKQEEVQGSRLL